MKSRGSRFAVLSHGPLVLFVVLVLSSVAVRAEPARTWKFDLKTPGTYEVHVQHEYKGAVIPRGSEATYLFEAGEKTLKRNLPFYPHGDGHPTIVLIADIPHPQSASVVVSGIPQPLLQQTKVYVVEKNSRYPLEWFDPAKSVDLKSAKVIRDILKRPEHEIDLGRAKLTIDKQIDPAINVEAGLRKIDAIVARIKTMPGFGISRTVDLQLLRRYLYEAGEWNEHRPYQYDLDDPLGTKISNKLLSNYMASKKGNCVTMPFLFVILAQRLGLDVTASTAPLHVFVKAKDEITGTWYNLETTSGATPARDAWYREQMPMTDQAIANGVYLRPLTKKEAVALMAVTLAEHYFDRKEFEETITISELVLEYSPKDAETMVRKASAHSRLMIGYYLEKFPSLDAVPANQRGHLQYLSNNNRLWFTKAEALGWREPRQEDEEKYLQSIKNAKAKQ